MTPRVTHLLDATAGEDSARLLSLLLARAGSAIQQKVLTPGEPPAALRLTEGSTTQLTRIPLRFGWPMFALPDVRRAVRTDPPDVLHVMGEKALGLAGALRRTGVSIPTIATISEPAAAPNVSRWWRSFGDAAGIEIACTSSIVRRRLVEAGVAPDATAVLRPGVDFGELQRARQSARREQILGGATEGPVLLLASPPTRAGGQYLGVWAGAILRQIWPGLRVVVPGRSRESRRIARLAEQLYSPGMVVMTGDRYAPAELLAIADALVMAALADVPTHWLALAMGAGVPIVASAVPAITEFIADRHNGFLCRPGEPHTLAIRIRTALEARDQVRSCVEVARGQAYDVFRAQQCIEHYTAAFRSLGQGRRGLAAVKDTAIAS